MKRIYVGNLPYSTTEQDLNEYFASCGEVVESIIIKYKSSNRSKGFGFVEFSTEDAVEKALALNDEEFGGRKLRINLAQEKQG